MRSFVVLLGLVFTLAPVRAQEAVPPADGYQAVVERLRPMIENEVRDKRLPALSIALVDDQRVVWAEGFGHQDREKKLPATARTVYRVGSVSKLFTDVAVMKLVEAGTLDLDAPVTTYLPDFKPKNTFDDRAITLRHLMTHRSGLVREPPAGNYFDEANPPLAETVASLNRTKLVYPIEKRIKYSNAAIAVVGYTLEKTQGVKFEDYLARAVLGPLGMRSSSFAPTPNVKEHLADAVMWTYHGREFPAPTFELGMSPAGSMYSTVGDLSKFLACLFAGGRVGDEQFLKPDTIAEMFRPQFAGKDAKDGFGIGFMVSQFEGKKRIGHGGAMYGFATELAALPSEKLGVIVVAARDVANPVVERIADDALRLMLAMKAKKPLPALDVTTRLTPEAARRLAGRYESDKRWFEIAESFGRAYLTPGRGGFRTEVRKLGADLWIDDVLGWGPKIGQDGDKLMAAGTSYEKQPDRGPPPAPPEAWAGLIGEYGWDHNTLYILERNGQLHALIEWVFLYPLTQKEPDLYAFPDYGLYHGEHLVFTRDPSGRATQVEAAKVVFPRRQLDGEEGKTFRIAPQRPVDQLRTIALGEAPPREDRDFRKPDLVDLATLDPTLKFDIRYTTDNNFLSAPVYTQAKAFLQRPAAEAMLRAHKKLAASGYGLLIHDGYRPWYVTKMFWDATPDKLRYFVADPSKGSRHNRGCAVDLTLYDLKTGKPVEMVGGYDEFSDRSFPDYMGGTSRQRWHRDLLRRTMEAEGFTVYEAEWWHFDYKDWAQYPILNLRFEDLEQDEWKPLFNGRDLDGWSPKIKGCDLGENFGDTFRVENGVLKVGYDKYDAFANKFGHLFYKDKFSHYILRVEYRFVGAQARGGPGWAIRNSGVMFHCQDPKSIRKEQDFPVSIEAQFLGGMGKGNRPTNNVCTPGTHIVMNGKLHTPHCTNSKSKTIHGDEWVTAEIEVHGAGKVIHRVNGEVVLEYEQPQLDPKDADAKKLIQNGKVLIEAGYIALQSESHPIEFRKVEIKVLRK